MCDWICKRGLIRTFSFSTLRLCITQPQFDLQLRNSVVALAYHYTNMREKCSIVTYSHMKLCLFSIAKSDTYIALLLQMRSHMRYHTESYKQNPASRMDSKLVYTVIAMCSNQTKILWNLSEIHSEISRKPKHFDNVHKFWSWWPLR